LSICSPCKHFHIRNTKACLHLPSSPSHSPRIPRMLLTPTSSQFAPATATAISSAATTTHRCWLHTYPMSLWLSTPSISIADVQTALLESVQFPSHSAMFIFLWTVFVTAVVILLLAISATFRAPRHDKDTPFSVSRFRSPSLWAVKLGDEEGGDLMLRVGVDGAAGGKGI